MNASSSSQEKISTGSPSELSDEVLPCALPGCSGLRRRIQVGRLVTTTRCPACSQRVEEELALEASERVTRAEGQAAAAAGVPRAFEWAALKREARQVLALGSKPFPGVGELGVFWVTAGTDEVPTINALRAVADGAALVLAGPRGRGKSHLAAGWLLDRARLGQSARWLSVRALALDLEGSWDSAGYRNARLTLEAAALVDALVIDHFGADSGSRLDQELERLVTLRAETHRSIVLTTRLDRGQLRRRWPELAARLEAMTRRPGGAWIWFEGANVDRHTGEPA